MYSCKKCEQSITEDELAEYMVKGCDKCGNTVFKMSKSSQKDIASVTKKLEERHENVAIHMKDTGTYEVNLDALVNRDSGLDPLLIQDKNGKINIILNPDP